MVDRYIDLDETQLYGAYTVKQLRSTVAPMIPEMGMGVLHVAELLEEHTERVAQLVDDSRTSNADTRAATEQKEPILQQARQFLGRFGKLLDAGGAPDSERLRFFPKDGTVKGVGRTASDVLLAVSRIAVTINEQYADHPLYTARLPEARTLAATLSGVLEQSTNTRTARQSITPELEAARQAWLHIYNTSKLVAEAVLRLSGKANLMPRIFYDLAVPNNQKVTHIDPPADLPADSPADDVPNQ